MRRSALALFLFLALAGYLALIPGPGAQASPGATITVNSTVHGPPTPGVLTLQEAMLLATGGLAVGDLDSGECGQVSNSTYGPPCSTTDSIGAASADTIDFDTAVVFPPGSPGHIYLSFWPFGGLAALSTGNDTIDGSSAGVLVDGQGIMSCFYISSNGNTIKGLAMQSCDPAAVEIYSGAQNNVIGGTTADERNVISGNAWGVRISDSGTTGNTVIGNYIGTDGTGTIALGNNAGGVLITGGAQNNIIGGTTVGERNVISGNGTGVSISDPGTSGNTVKGNYIGTNAAGTAALPNWDGVEIGSGAQNNIIGGTTDSEGNVISGNNNAGVGMSGTAGNGNTVTGNFIGTDAAGTAALPNSYGVRMSGQDDTIGGTTASERNVISGNTYYGVFVQGSGNTVKGNYIGTNAAGTGAVPNDYGVVMWPYYSQSSTVGGSTEGERNVISGNSTYGVFISGSPSNTVKGNYIGLDASGSGSIANGIGVMINGSAVYNTIGGSSPSDRNVISGNSTYGVAILTGGDAASLNTVKGNYIGIGPSGDVAIGNDVGVYLWGNVLTNTVGGSTEGERNVISGNESGGVVINSSSNIVKGNYIGTNASGSAAIPNSIGVDIPGGQGNIIGGTTPGEGNVVAYNTSHGVRVDGGGGNTMSGNSIHSNGGKGIDLTNGGNTELAPPIIDGLGGSVHGHTNPKCYPCTVEVFSDYEDEGRIYHGWITTNNDATGTWVYPGTAGGRNVTATITDSAGNTSEFSDPFPFPVGGVAELPDVSGSSAPNYMALVGLAAAALLAVTAGGWYAGRRWLR
jgi:titin